MRPILHILFFFLFVEHISAQQLFPMRASTDSIHFKVIAHDGKLALEMLQQQPTLKFLKFVGLDDADLAVHVEIPKNTMAGISNQFNLKLQPMGGVLQLPLPGKIVILDNKTSPQVDLRWLDATESDLLLGKEYVLHIKVTELGLVDCREKRPEFPNNAKIVYVTAGVIGFASILTAGAFQLSKRKWYAKYLQKWDNGKTFGEAQTEYSIAKRNGRYAQFCLYSGIAILAADSYFSIKKYQKIRLRQRLYDRFCNESRTSVLWKFKPITDYAALGINLSLTF